MPQPPQSDEERKQQDSSPEGEGEELVSQDPEVVKNVGGKKTPPISTPPTRRKRRPARSSSTRMFGLIAVVAIGVTIYMFLEHNVFSHNRPLVWSTFDSAKIEYAHQNGSVVVLLIGPFQTRGESTQLVELVDVSPVRAQAHRLKNRFCVVPNPESEDEKKELSDWLNQFFESRTIEEFSPQGRPYFLILAKSNRRPIVIDSNGDPAGDLAERLHEIRIQ